MPISVCAELRCVVDVKLRLRALPFDASLLRLSCIGNAIRLEAYDRKGVMHCWPAGAILRIEAPHGSAERSNARIFLCGSGGESASITPDVLTITGALDALTAFLVQVRGAQKQALLAPQMPTDGAGLSAVENSSNMRAKYGQSDRHGVQNRRGRGGRGNDGKGGRRGAHGSVPSAEPTGPVRSNRTAEPRAADASLSSLARDALHEIVSLSALSQSRAEIIPSMSAALVAAKPGLGSGNAPSAKHRRHEASVTRPQGQPPPDDSNGNSGGNCGGLGDPTLRGAAEGAGDQGSRGRAADVHGRSNGLETGGHHPEGYGSRAAPTDADNTGSANRLPPSPQVTPNVTPNATPDLTPNVTPNSTPNGTPNVSPRSRSPAHATNHHGTVGSGLINQPVVGATEGHGDTTADCPSPYHPLEAQPKQQWGQTPSQDRPGRKPLSALEEQLHGNAESGTLGRCEVIDNGHRGARSGRHASKRRIFEFPTASDAIGAGMHGDARRHGGRFPNGQRPGLQSQMSSWRSLGLNSLAHTPTGPDRTRRVLSPPPRSPSPPDGCMQGLPNLGNTCYVNATLQCLSVRVP